MQAYFVLLSTCTIFAHYFSCVPIEMRRYLYTIATFLTSLFCIQAQRDFIVVIDPGHGGRDPGSIGAISREKNINLSVSLLLGEIIEKNHKDTRVIYTRKTDVFIPLDERANIANRNKADLFISIHVNSVRDKNPSGTETYTLGLANSEENREVAMRENSVILMEDDYLHKYEGFDPKSSESYIIFEFMQNKHMEQSILLASEIQKAFAESNRGNRSVRQAGLLVLRKTSMPSVLIELGFLSNRVEERYLVSNEGQNALAQSIYKAFSNYKNDYNRKLGNISNVYVETLLIPKEEIETNETNTNVTNTTTPSDNKDSITYKIQILTSDKQIPEKDTRFKGYDEISFYIENGIYKYTYGSTSDYRKILDMHKKAEKDFKGAFIIRIKDGKRINN